MFGSSHCCEKHLVKLNVTFDLQDSVGSLCKKKKTVNERFLKMKKNIIKKQTVDIRGCAHVHFNCNTAI